MRSSRIGRFLALALLGTAAVVACSVPDVGSLSAEDEERIRALQSAYVDGWLRDDTAAVLGTLSPDVVLMPGGARPIVGWEAAREFWWPNDGSVTTITSYETAIDEIDGGPSLAYVRGTGTLGFVYERGGVRVERSTRNMTLTIVRKGSDDTWRITRRMWAPLGE